MASGYIGQVSMNDSHTAPTKLFASMAEKVVLIRDCGEPAAMLYEFYLGKIKDRNYEHTDKKTATAFGWSATKARDTRLRLEKAEWIASEITRSRNRRLKFGAYFVGQLAVMEFKIETCTPKLTVQEVVDKLNGLGHKYTDNQNHKTLKHWIKKGYLDLSSSEQDAFDKDRTAFVNVYFHYIGK